MFNGCTSLTGIYLDKWNVSKVECTSRMFQGCSSLAYITTGDPTINKVFSNLKWADYMFAGTALTTVYFTSYYDETVIPSLLWAEGMFAGCKNLTEVKFAEGVALNTLYLPESVTSLKLVQANLLKNVITTEEPPKP
jgi:surface protein